MPLYEYVCRSCGHRFERMRKVSERLAAPACPACALEVAALAVSVPGRVGAGNAAAAAQACAAGPSCCGGGCFHPN